MSFIINEDLFSHSIQSDQINEFQSVNTTQQDNLSFIQKNFLNNFTKTLTQTGIHHRIRNKNNNQTNVIIPIPLNSAQNHILLITLSINSKLMFLKAYSNILTQDLKILTIKSKHQRILLNKLITKNQTQNHIKTIVNLFNGELKFIQSQIYFTQQFDKIQNKGFKFNEIIKKMISQSEILLKKVTNLFSKINSNVQISKKQFHVSTLKHQILRYIHRSSIEPVFDVSLGSSKYDKIQHMQGNQRKQIKQLLKHIDCNLNEFHDVQLFLKPDYQMKKAYTYDYFLLDDIQQKHLKQKLQQPIFSGKSSALEPKFVYNVIEIQQPKSIKLNKISVGGFSEIFKSDVLFWYLMTVSNDKMEKIQAIFQSKKYLNQNQNSSYKQMKNQTAKRSSIKKLVKKSLVLKKSTNQQNKIIHEQSIVAKFKGISSIFLPQYFKLSSEQDIFSQYLLMQYLPYPTLQQYMEFNKNSLSFLTKIHLSMMMVKGLRVLKDCGIVHLDLKPSNCIVSKKLIVKLIDFGESYCNELSQSKLANLKPAFTIPYCCPQIITQSQSITPIFTQKSDIYSWSMILFEMIFERLPFFIPKKSLHKKYPRGQYMKSFYYVPQQEQNYGEKEIMSFLRLLIMKGLVMEENQRPYCNWLVIILKDCLKYLVAMESG